MSYCLEDVKFEDDKFVILEVEKGYEVYIKGATCMTRRGQIGFKGEKGYNIAIEMIQRGIIK